MFGIFVVQDVRRVRRSQENPLNLAHPFRMTSIIVVITDARREDLILKCLTVNMTLNRRMHREIKTFIIWIP